jgi:hypothetical protein
VRLDQLAWHGQASVGFPFNTCFGWKVPECLP